MTQIRFDTIGRNITKYKEQICLFFGSLDQELIFFNNTNNDRIWNAENTILAFDNDKIIGLAGIVKYHHIFHSGYIIVKKEYHSKGVGGFLHLKRKDEARKNCNILISWINPGNKLSMELNRLNGAKHVGTREGILCFALTFNKKGQVLFYLLKAAFPIRKFLDNLKKKLLPNQM
jgi:RimJ/RimL family protein N-acetyltransferase